MRILKTLVAMAALLAFVGCGCPSGRCKPFNDSPAASANR